MSKSGQKRVRVLIVQLILTLWLLLPAELFVALLQSQKDSRSDTINGNYMPIRLKPGFQGVVGGQAFSTNNLGFRDTPDVLPNAPYSGQRILILGDSISFGFGVAPAETYPARLEHLLENSSDSRVQVLNAAGQGYSPSSYWAYLAHEGLQLQPDVVIMQVEFSNDVSDEALLRVVDPPGGLPRVQGGRYVVTWDGNLLGVPIRGPYSYEKTYLYGTIAGHLLESIATYFPPQGPLSAPSFTYFSIGSDRALLVEKRIEQGWKRLFDSLISVRQLAQREDFRLLLLPIPNRFYFQESSDPDGSRFSRSIFERGWERARQDRLETVDVRPALAGQGGDRLYLDFAHLDPTGQRALAQVLADRLRE